MGFEPMTFAMPVQCWCNAGAMLVQCWCNAGAMLYQLSYEATQLGTGQFVGLICYFTQQVLSRQQIDLLPTEWVLCSFGRATHRHRKGHGPAIGSLGAANPCTAVPPYIALHSVLLCIRHCITILNKSDYLMIVLITFRSY